MSSLVRDLRYAARVFMNQPGSTMSAVLSLAIGIGGTTAIFTVVDSVLLRPLPYKDPDRLVVALRAPTATGPVSPADFFDYRRDARSFEALAAAQAWGGTLGGGDRSERIAGLHVSADMFALLGVPPAIGRVFVEGDDQPGREKILVLSHGLWLRRFGGDPSVLGRTASINGQPYVVVGVMPPSFRFAPFWQTRAEMWAPLSLAHRLDDRAGRSLRLFGRLKEGVSRSQAQAEMTAIATRLERLHPEANTGVGVTVQPLLDRVVSGIRPMLLALMATVVFVLLIACANVANTLLARASSRQKEIGLRLAIGASHWQIIRQLLTESLLLAALGQVAGVVFAFSAVNWLLSTLPAGSLPRQHEVALDPRVLLLASIAALAAGLTTGLVPALQILRSRVSAVLQGGGQGTTDGVGRTRVRTLLVTVEVMLAVVLLAGAGLMLRTMVKLRAIDPGFRIDHVAVADVSLAGTAHATPAARDAMFLRIRERLRALPGVTAVSAINHLPLAGDVWNVGYTIEGRPEPPPGQRWAAVYRIVQPGYFGTVELPLLEGRDFSEADGAASPHVAIVNKAMADRRWPGESPIGRRIFMPGMSEVKTSITIIGVAANARQWDWTSAPDDEVYLAFAQRSSEFGLSGLTFLLRTAVDPADVAAAVPRAVSEVDRGVAVSENTTMAVVAAAEVWRERLTADLSTAFGLVALALAAMGVYAVVSYSVARRSREFGVRIALGATRIGVLRLALAEALRPVLIGASIGLLAARAATRAIQGLLFGVSAVDPLALGGSVATLTVVAIVAAWIPARHASGLDPVAALRRE